MTRSFSKAFGVVYTNWLYQLHFVLLFTFSIAVKKSYLFFHSYQPLLVKHLERQRELCFTTGPGLVLAKPTHLRHIVVFASKKTFKNHTWCSRKVRYWQTPKWSIAIYNFLALSVIIFVINIAGIGLLKWMNLIFM